VNIVNMGANGHATNVDLPVGEGEFIRELYDLRKRLPQIRLITRVPVIDDEFNIVQPGYNGISAIYYDGPQIVPAQRNHTSGHSAPALFFL